ncbi:MAG: oxygen-dependent coproporphyrinogen oxidase [Salibacteraceae bacterium]
MASSRDEIANWFQSLQHSISKSIEDCDGKASFESEQWNRPGGGGGDTRVIENGAIIEKGGVNFSAVYGELPENIKAALKVDSKEFFATGVSIVMHPENPFVPIIHMNVRYFEMSDEVWWFGGGIDLTPHYVDVEDADWFHARLKSVCNRFDAAFHDRFSKWADEYFFIKHRNESRGVSGIFFDRLNSSSEGKSKEELFAFVKAVGEEFAPIYTHFMRKYADKPFSDKNKEWQMHRRSRYVEFNLVLDKGTKFGLDTDGRIDSILMSLPPSTGWKYTQHWPKDGDEMKTQSYLQTVHVPAGK